MDQIKIGGFIAERRRKKGWTQLQLADRLGLTDKAVSKWENGKSMPDLAVFAPLCRELDISLNELMLGEMIPEDQFRAKSDAVLMTVISEWLGQEAQPAAASAEDGYVLELHEVCRKYDDDHGRFAVDRVSFSLPENRFIAIMGASGCGKTTLLNLIAAIDTATSGTITIAGTDITKLSEQQLADFRREQLGFIFQEYNLIENLTLYENIALALSVQRSPKESRTCEIEAAAEKLGISEVLDRYPSEVSGGQRQRCACARAVVVRPRLILADEPTGALDSGAARKLLEVLAEVQHELKTAILMVTHDAVAASHCDQILFMQDGRIVRSLNRGQMGRQAFFTEILKITAQLSAGSAG